MKKIPIALECNNIRKEFGRSQTLFDISFQLPKGQVLAIVGHNGAGKTTLIKILAGLVTPSAGQVIINGYDARINPKKAQASLGYAPTEERSFFWRLSGQHNLLFFGRLQSLRGKDLSTRIARLLREIGFTGDARAKFKDYSAGMRQALCLVRAMLHDPPILLLDEPTRSLSPDSARNVRSMILDRVRRGSSVIISSHNLEEVHDLADQIALMQQGRIVAMGTEEELRQKGHCPCDAPLEDVLKTLLEQDNEDLMAELPSDRSCTPNLADEADAPQSGDQ